MAKAQAIKRRIKSVKNTKQITKAMELVAASKMRKSQEASLRSKLYSNTARDLLAKISIHADVSKNKFYQQPIIVRNRLHVVVTSDKGLAGAYNSNVLKMFYKSIEDDRQNSVDSKVIVIGSKGVRAISKIEDIDILSVYENLSDHLNESEIQPVVAQIFNSFESGEVQDVVVHFTSFKSTIKQTATKSVLLPIVLNEEHKKNVRNKEVKFEPSPEEVLETITPRLVEVQFYQAMLESLASEHSMRMMAMKNASDNASDIIDDLTLEFNSARQAAITQELAEISGGVEAIS